MKDNGFEKRSPGTPTGFSRLSEGSGGSRAERPPVEHGFVDWRSENGGVRRTADDGHRDLVGERFFADLTGKRLRRGVFQSVPEVVEAIEGYILHHNEDPKPFTWTKKASAILEKVMRAGKDPG